MKVISRKVNLVGGTTYTISLPPEYVKENNVTKGENIDIMYDSDKIVITKKDTQIKEKTINIDGMTYFHLAWALSNIYRSGYSKIRIEYSNDRIYNMETQTYEDIKNSILEITKIRMIGLDIISQQKNTIELECFSDDRSESMQKIELRIYLLLKELFFNIIDAIREKEYESFHNHIQVRIDRIIRFTNYYLRTLFSSDKTDNEKKALHSFHIQLDHLILNKIKHLSTKLNKYGCTKKLEKYLMAVFGFYLDQYSYLFQKKSFLKLGERRKELKKRIEDEEFNNSELKVLMEITVLLDTIVDFADLLITKEFK